MTITMDDKAIKTIKQVRIILESSRDLEFKGLGRDEKYRWIEEVLARFNYFELEKKAKGEVKAYLERMSGLSRAQMTRLVNRKLNDGSIKALNGRRHCFETIYTKADKDLLVETDNVHGRLSGPATKRIFERQYHVYGDERYEQLKGISSAHIYNLRSSRTYQLKAQTFARTQSVHRSIGIRRKPETMGKPGWIRVDTVHQGELDGEKGVYHINLVDAVLQWEIVLCVEKISEVYLVPALEEALSMFPFLVLGFHSDNGSEFINSVVARLLNKLLIEQTKSRSGRTNDNALVEGKNGSVIRKHMGYWHIEQKGAPLIHVFYQEHFNEYLNFHRPCGFATVTVDEKGRRRKKYETYQTPYERLKSLENAGQYLRVGMSFDALDKIAAQETDNESAARMQKAKGKLFEKLGRYNKRKTYNPKASIQTQKGGRDPKTTTTSTRFISGSSLD
jgi:transposase InsO family protein